MPTRLTRDLYRGKAIIMNISFEAVQDWKDWEKRDLPESDQENAFKIVYDVAEGDTNGARHEVKVEISHRELKGKMLEYYTREDGSTPTQIDVALRSLVGQGIVPRGATEASLALAIDDAVCGNEVTIRHYEEQSEKDGKWWPRTVFASKFQRITGGDKAARLAAFLAGKPAPVATASIPAAANTAIPAPEEDPDNLPF